MKRCSKCGLISTYPNADIDSSGECKYCRTFIEKRFLGEEKLLDKLGKHKKIGVTVSGGKDSIYAWYWLVNKLGADRVIAFNHNKVNAVDTLAIENIKRAQKILKSEVVFVNDYDFYPRFLKNIEAYIETPNPAILRAVLCAGCRYGISKRLFEEALKYDITTVINAASYLEEVPFKRYHMNEYGDGNEVRGLLRGLCENEKYLTKDNLDVIIRDHYNRHTDMLANKKNEFNIEYIDIFDYIENDVSVIKDTVISKLKWQYPEGVDWHFDCIVEEFKQFFYLVQLGYSELDYTYSQMVKYGLKDKESAIKELEEKNNNILLNYDRLLKKLEEFNISKDIRDKFKENFEEKARSLTLSLV